jgi:hypothetical protein
MDELSTRMFSVDKIYKIDDSLKDVLREAAFRGSRIELEIDNEATVVGIQLPATAWPR